VSVAKQESMSLRERQRRFAMAEVERVALDLFAARGYESVSVDDIVAAAGTSQRTFFRYFASKDEVVLAYERYLHERFVAALRSRPASEGPVRALANAFTSTSDVAAADMPTVLKRARVLAAAPVLRERAMGERRARIHEIADELLARDRSIGARPSGAQRRRARVVAASVTAVAQAEWDVWVAEGISKNPSERIRQAIDELVAGLAALDRPGGLRTGGRHGGR
jgi:AcrR family transcriptional regulator